MTAALGLAGLVAALLALPAVVAAAPDATIEEQARALTRHAIGWVTAAQRLGLEVREEEPEDTMRRVLAALEEQ